MAQELKIIISKSEQDFLSLVQAYNGLSDMQKRRYLPLPSKKILSRVIQKLNGLKQGYKTISSENFYKLEGISRKELSSKKASTGRGFNRNNPSYIIYFETKDKKYAQLAAALLKLNIISWEQYLKGRSKTKRKKNLVLLLPQEKFKSRALFQLNQSLWKAGDPYGLIPLLDSDMVYYHFIKIFLHQRCGYHPSGIFGYFPVESYGGEQSPQGEIWLGPNFSEQAVVEKLKSPRAFLGMLTHSSGLDGFLGKNLTLCTNVGYPQSKIKEEKLYPCFHGGECNRGEAKHFYPEDFKSKVVAFFGCGGVVPSDGKYLLSMSLGRRFLENNYLENYFGSFYLYEEFNEGFFWSLEPFLRNSTIGTAVMEFKRKLISEDEEMAHTFCLFGFPSTKIPVIQPQKIKKIKTLKNKLWITVPNLKKGKIHRYEFAAPHPYLKKNMGSVLVYYGKEEKIPHNGLRGNLRRTQKGFEISIISFSKELKNIQLEIINAHDSLNRFFEFIKEASQNLRFTKKFINWAAKAYSNPHQTVLSNEIESLLDLFLQIENRLNRNFRGALIDRRVHELLQDSCNAHMENIHGKILQWSLGYLSQVGSRISKQWIEFLKKEEGFIREKCPYCDSRGRWALYQSPTDPQLRRDFFTCVNCWYGADLANRGYPKKLMYNQRVRAGTPLTIRIEISDAGPSPWKFLGGVVLEDFETERRNSLIGLFPSQDLEPKRQKKLQATLVIPKNFKKGQYILSSPYLINGSLNVIRNFIEVL